MSTPHQDPIEAAFSWAEKCLEREAQIEAVSAPPKTELWDHQVAAISAIKDARSLKG
jgi:hypothetical protein